MDKVASVRVSRHTIDCAVVPLPAPGYDVLPVRATFVPMSLREALVQVCLIFVPWLLFVVLNDFRRPRG